MFRADSNLVPIGATRKQQEHAEMQWRHRARATKQQCTRTECSPQLRSQLTSASERRIAKSSVRPSKCPSVRPSTVEGIRFEPRPSPEKKIAKVPLGRAPPPSTASGGKGAVARDLGTQLPKPGVIDETHHGQSRQSQAVTTATSRAAAHQIVRRPTRSRLKKVAPAKSPRLRKADARRL